MITREKLKVSKETLRIISSDMSLIYGGENPPNNRPNKNGGNSNFISCTGPYIPPEKPLVEISGIVIEVVSF